MDRAEEVESRDDLEMRVVRLHNSADNGDVDVFSTNVVR
jgi:hypothetical protein